MSTDRDVTRIVRSWLDEGATQLPDRVLDNVLDLVPVTPQRRAWWPARRFRDMNNPLKLAIAAAAVVAVAVAGMTLLPRGGNVGVVGPSSRPTPTSSPTSSSIVNFAGGNYVPGTTYAIEDRCCVAFRSRMTFTIPATGWYAPLESWRIGKNVTGGSDLFDLYVTPMFVGNIYTGGCDWKGTELSPRVGPTVDDLATALVAQAGPGASPPVSVTVGGHPGKKVELAIPEDLDVTTCDSDGDYPIFGWFVSDGGFGAQPYTHGNGQHDAIYIVDVDGTRQVIDAMYLPNASAADRAEQDQIIASIRFESLPAGPSPSG
jgi:hypothetical protein